eukprot:scaffold546_cov115-Cylindrotheca_fusiformis.AAC.5
MKLEGRGVLVVCKISALDQRCKWGASMKKRLGGYCAVSRKHGKPHHSLGKLIIPGWQYAIWPI